MKRPCPIAITCPGIDAPEPDWPVLNVSAEAPDPIIFTQVVWPDVDPYRPRCLYQCNPDPDPVNCADIIQVAASQAMADMLAQAAGLVCPPLAGGACSFANDAQSAIVECPDGSRYTFTVPAGAMLSGAIDCSLAAPWMDMANAWALSYAYQQASNSLNCTVRPLQPLPRGRSSPGPRLSDNPGWACVGEEPIPEYNTYTISNAGGQAYTFEVVAGMLPPGTSLLQTGDASAMLVGTLTTPGNYSYTIRATSTTGPLRVIEVTDSFMVLGISNSTLPTASEGVAYGPEQLIGAGGTNPFTFSSDDLPTGFALTSDGILTSDSSISIANHTFHVTITDAVGRECVVPCSISIVASCVADVAGALPVNQNCVVPPTIALGNWATEKLGLVAPSADPALGQTEWDGNLPVFDNTTFPGLLFWLPAGTILPGTLVGLSFNGLHGEDGGVAIIGGSGNVWNLSLTGSVGGVPTLLWNGNKATGENPLGTYMRDLVTPGIADGPPCFHVTGTYPKAQAWWPMNLGSALNETDAVTGLALACELNCSVLEFSSVAGLLNNALQLDAGVLPGAHSLITGCNNAKLKFNGSGFTLVAWVNSTDVSGDPLNRIQISYEFDQAAITHTAQLARVGVNGDNWIASIDGLGNISKASAAGWHFLVITYDALTGTLGFDIDQAGMTTAITPVPLIGINTFGHVRLSNSCEAGKEIRTLFDEVALYDGVLTSAQLDCLYNSGSGKTW